MSKYRRYYIPNAIIFITSVTHNRKPFLKNENDISILWDTLKEVKKMHPFRLLAYTILPDHFHWLMQVNDSEWDFSKILKSIKWNFTFNYKKAHNLTSSLRIWQPRFWDHIIRNEQDLSNHFDYIHWNPVKHGLVMDPADWPHSSYNFWYERGEIEAGWGRGKQPSSIEDMDFE